MEKLKKSKTDLFDESREKYLFTFLLAFGISAAVMLIFSIPQGGIFTYFGDYNYQQIPFYYHVHEAVREGRLMWDFTTDLGSDIMKSYTFYLTGSPFFWLTIPFPNASLPYLMLWFFSLKTAVAALTAYAYIRSFSSNTNACCLGGMLYAFSGFQLYNIMFNHFHDATAFFPLLLLASDKLFMERKKGLFALTVAVCASTNYFFFWGMAVFTVIYFAVNVFTGRYKFKLGAFFGYAFEAVLGVLMAAVVLLPSAAAVMNNSRAGTTLPLSQMFAYTSDPMIYLHVLKSFFTIPDLALNSALPASDQINGASVSAYLPFVSMCGVIGYFIIKRSGIKKDMPALMLIISVIAMLIPVFNSAFYMFNQQYYARWFYMPVLIMCVMTAVTVEKDVLLLKKGMIPCIGAAGLYLAFGLIYGAVIKSGENASVLGKSVNSTYLLTDSAIPIGCLALLYSMLGDKSLTDNKKRLTELLKRVMVCCGLFMMITIGLGKMTIHNTKDYIETGLRSRPQIDAYVKAAQEDPDQLFRVDMCEQYHNYNMMWDLSSCSSFISLVSPSIDEFYEAIGFPRGVSSQTPVNFEALRAFLSVKYYFDMPLYDEGVMREPFPKLANAVESFDFKSADHGGGLLYENNCYIPIGFTYDQYTTAEEMAALNNRVLHTQALLEALVLSDEQIGRYGDILTPYDVSDSSYEYERLKEISEERSAEACEYFHPDSKGFDAAIELNEEKLVFFSVPYDEDWSAEINGEPVRIEKVSYGFMAVKCPAGRSEIRFDYVSKPTLYGLYISLGAIAVFAVYFATARRSRAKNADSE